MSEKIAPSNEGAKQPSSSNGSDVNENLLNATKSFSAPSFLASELLPQFQQPTIHDAPQQQQQQQQPQNQNLQQPQQEDAASAPTVPSPREHGAHQNAAPMFFTQSFVSINGEVFPLKPKQNAAPILFTDADGQPCVVFKGQAFDLKPEHSQPTAAIQMLPPPAVPAQLQPHQPATPATGAAGTRLPSKLPPLTAAQKKKVENLFNQQNLQQQQDERFDWKKLAAEVGVPSGQARSHMRCVKEKKENESKKQGPFTFDENKAMLKHALTLVTGSHITDIEQLTGPLKNVKINWSRVAVKLGRVTRALKDHWKAMKNPTEKLKRVLNEALPDAVAEKSAAVVEAAAPPASPKKRGPSDVAPEQPDLKLPKLDAGTAFI